MKRESQIHKFIPDVYHPCNGQYVLWKDFLADFYGCVRAHHFETPEELWPAKRVICELLGEVHPVGRGPRNKKIIGNLSKRFSYSPRWLADGKGNIRLERAP